MLFKIVTIFFNRLISISGKVIKLSQTAFIKGRFIFDGVVSLHEILNEIHTKKSDGVLFKIDFEKAFDKIKWPFLLQILQMKGFPNQFSDWVMKTVTSGKVAIKVNDENGVFFPTFQGLRQGDSMSPLLFDHAADALSIMIERAVAAGIIRGFGDQFVDGGVAILQYADDTILLIQNDLCQARNLKFILGLFEMLSGLKINFHKREVYCLGGS